MGVPRIFSIREAHHRILNPLRPAKLAALGAALRLPAGGTVLDLACGKGELLCTWARDHGVRGVGVDLDPPFVAAARARARELRVSHAVEFVEGDASGHVSPEPVDLASCCGATWIGGGVTGTVRLLERSLRPGGIMLIGEPYWRRDPGDGAAVAGSAASSREDFLPLWDLVGVFREAGYDPVEMVLSDQDDWDRYVAAHWLSMRRWLDAHPDDGLAAQVRHELDTEPERYLRYQREYLGWGVFALMRR